MRLRDTKKVVPTRCEWLTTADGILGTPPALKRNGSDDDVVASLPIPMCVFGDRCFPGDLYAAVEVDSNHALAIIFLFFLLPICNSGGTPRCALSITMLQGSPAKMIQNSAL